MEKTFHRRGCRFPAAPDRSQATDTRKRELHSCAQVTRGSGQPLLHLQAATQFTPIA